MIAMQPQCDSIAIKVTPSEAKMASLTIRKLAETLKTYLRLRSAQHGRSVEEEVRVILRGLIEPAEQQQPAIASHPVLPNDVPVRSGVTGEARVTLIIGGGIAAYKALDQNQQQKDAD